MKIGRLNHVGVAVPDIELAKQTYVDLYGADDVTETRDFPQLGVRVAFVRLDNAEIELLEPLGDDSPVHKFLERNPKGGQHHVCFEVADIAAARDAMVEKGATVLGTGKPYVGAHGVPVIFIHPRHSHGLLVELMQEPFRTGGA